MSKTSAERGLEWALGELLRVWSRQFDAAQGVLRGGSAELLRSFSRVHALQAQWDGLADDDHAQRSALSHELHEASEQALHGLQFADRLDQMLAVLHGDVERLRRDMDTLRDADPATLQRWLDELAAHYTTDEQRERHGASAAEAPGQSGVDFF